MSKIQGIFFLCFLILSCGLLYSLDINTCLDLNEDYLNTTLYLTQDLNNWGTTCFSLNNSTISDYLEIDCNDHEIYRDNDGLLFDQNSYDINKIIFKNCDINISYGNIFFQINSDINFINILDSNVLFNNGNLFYLDLINDSINFNFSNSYFYKNYITTPRVFTFSSNSKINNFIVRNMNFNKVGDLFYFTGNTDLNYIKIFDSNFIFSNYILYTYNFSDLFLDLNFLNSNFYMNNNNFAYNFNNSIINNLQIHDGNYHYDALLYANSSSSINAKIYLNIFQDFNIIHNYEHDFIVCDGTCNLDFNNTLEENEIERATILDDDSSYIGGNLWLDVDGNNICDIYALNDTLEPYGICDSSLIIFGTDKNYYDYYPLITYDDGLPNADLNVYDISLNSSTEGNILVTCNFGNSGDLALNDYNVYFFINNVLKNSVNITSELLSNAISFKTFSWNANKGTYNLKCDINSIYDNNLLNNSYSESFTITSDGGSDGDSKTYNVKLTSNYSGSLSSSTNTTITSNITKSGTKLAESLTYKIYALKGSEKILVYSKNISASEVTNGQTIDKEIKASDLSGNLLDYISNDKISFVIEIDSDDDVSKDNTETLNIPTNYFEVILNANIDSKLTSDINAKIIGKVSKLGNLNDVILNLYLISENNKKLIDQKTIESYPYDYNYFLNINTITENLDYIDSQGYINLKLELESNDTNAENNSKNLRSKVEFFDFDIENILLNDNNYELNDTFEFNILETYNLVYVLNYSSINKLGFAEIRFINDSKNRQINSQKFTFGKLDGKDFNKILYEFKINLLTLMSEQDARLLIKSVMNLDNSEDSQKTINSIITNLGNNLNLKHDENKSYFLSNVDNITIDLIGSDLEKINSNLIFEYVYNFVDTPSPKKDENKSSSSKENVKELPTDNDYVLKYKQKIGINELQEIYIFDTKDNKLSNINVLIDSNNFSWYLASDFNGLVIFDPNFSGIYNISLPYPNIKIKAEFEVIDNYISLNDEFVEITSQSSYSVMKNKIFNIFIFVAIIIILIVGIILYFVFKPRKISSIYDFSKSNYYNDYNLRTEIKKEQLEKDIKFAYNEEKILEKKLKDKIGYDL